MADTLERDHIDGGLALLRADTGLTVYPDAEGFVPEAPSMPDHYVRVYTSIERPINGASNRLDGRSSTWVVRWYVHGVGPNEYAALAVAMRVRAAWLDITPTVAGRVCGPIRQEASQPTSRTEHTGTAVYEKVDVYRMQTSPSAAIPLVDP